MTDSSSNNSSTRSLMLEKELAAMMRSNDTARTEHSSSGSGDDLPTTPASPRSPRSPGSNRGKSRSRRGANSVTSDDDSHSISKKKKSKNSPRGLSREPRRGRRSSDAEVATATSASTATSRGRSRSPASRLAAKKQAVKQKQANGFTSNHEVPEQKRRGRRKSKPTAVIAEEDCQDDSNSKTKKKGRGRGRSILRRRGNAIADDDDRSIASTASTATGRSSRSRAGKARSRSVSVGRRVAKLLSWPLALPLPKRYSTAAGGYMTGSRDDDDDDETEGNDDGNDSDHGYLAGTKSERGDSQRRRQGRRATITGNSNNNNNSNQWEVQSACAEPSSPMLGQVESKRKLKRVSKGNKRRNSDGVMSEAKAKKRDTSIDPSTSRTSNKTAKKKTKGKKKKTKKKSSSVSAPATIATAKLPPTGTEQAEQEQRDPTNASAAKSVTSIDTTASLSSGDTFANEADANSKTEIDDDTASFTPSKTEEEAQESSQSPPFNGTTIPAISKSLSEDDDESPYIEDQQVNPDHAHAHDEPVEEVKQELQAEREVSNAREQCLAVWEGELKAREAKIKEVEDRSKQALQELDAYFCSVRASRLAASRYGTASLDQREQAIHSIEKVLMEERKQLKRERNDLECGNDGVQMDLERERMNSDALTTKVMQLENDLDTALLRAMEAEHLAASREDDKKQGFIKGELAVAKQDLDDANETIKEQQAEISSLKDYIKKIESGGALPEMKQEMEAMKDEREMLQKQLRMQVDELMQQLATKDERIDCMNRELEKARPHQQQGLGLGSAARRASFLGLGSSSTHARSDNHYASHASSEHNRFAGIGSGANAVFNPIDSNNHKEDSSRYIGIGSNANTVFNPMDRKGKNDELGGSLHSASAHSRMSFGGVKELLSNFGTTPKGTRKTFKSSDNLKSMEFNPL